MASGRFSSMGLTSIEKYLGVGGLRIVACRGCGVRWFLRGGASVGLIAVDKAKATPEVEIEPYVAPLPMISSSV